MIRARIDVVRRLEGYDGNRARDFGLIVGETRRHPDDALEQLASFIALRRYGDGGVRQNRNDDSEVWRVVCVTWQQ